MPAVKIFSISDNGSLSSVGMTHLAPSLIHHQCGGLLVEEKHIWDSDGHYKDLEKQMFNFL